MRAHPAIAVSCASALAARQAGSPPALDLPALALGRSELLKRFATVSDGRSDQGRDHPVAVVLTLCAAAVPAGMRSFTAIAGWVGDGPAEVPAGLYTAPEAIVPSKTTLWRVLTGADPAAVDAAVGAWPAEQAACTTSAPETPTGAHAPGLVAVAVDGKTLRGAVDSEGNQTHLLAADIRELRMTCYLAQHAAEHPHDPAG